jgi:C-terminal peptidase prc
MSKDDRLYQFEDVWWTVKDDYWYGNRNFRGLDWDEIFEEYRPRVRKATSAQEFQGLLRDMIERLNDDHSRYYPAWEVDEAYEGVNHLLGIELVLERKTSKEKAAVVIYIIPDSPADQAGLKRRDRILAIDGQALNDPLEDLQKIRGPASTAVQLKVQSPGEAPRMVTIERGRAAGTVRPVAKRLELHPTVGYVVLPEFYSYKISSRFEAELSKLLAPDNPVKGLVIDVRANGGGRIDALQRVFGQFFNKEEYLGRLEFVDGSSYALKSELGNLYEQLKDIPVVVLIDHDTHSAAEIFAAVMQFKKRAVLVGDRSGGNVEVVDDYTMEDGSLLALATGRFIRPDGVDLEGRGVIPDYQIGADWTIYVERDDPQILGAVKVLTRWPTATAIVTATPAATFTPTPDVTTPSSAP